MKELANNSRWYELVMSDDMPDRGDVGKRFGRTSHPPLKGRGTSAAGGEARAGTPDPEWDEFTPIHTKFRSCRAHRLRSTRMDQGKVIVL